MVWRIAVFLDTVMNLNQTSTFCNFENHEILSKMECWLVCTAQLRLCMFFLKNTIHLYWFGKMEFKRLQTFLFCGLQENYGEKKKSLKPTFLFK